MWWINRVQYRYLITTSSSAVSPRRPENAAQHARNRANGNNAKKSKIEPRGSERFQLLDLLSASQLTTTSTHRDSTPRSLVEGEQTGEQMVHIDVDTSLQADKHGWFRERFSTHTQLQ